MVIFGVEESQVISLWRDAVVNTLHLAAGRDVMITDAFRLGRFTAGRIRPILVKLNSTWDRRAVSADLTNLLLLLVSKAYTFHRMSRSIPDVRCRIMDHLTKKASTEGKEKR